MKSLKEIVGFLYQHFEKFCNIGNIVFLTIPIIIILMALRNVFQNQKKIGSLKEQGPQLGGGEAKRKREMKEARLHKCYMSILAILCVYIVIVRIDVQRYQLKLDKIKSIENEEMKLREKLWSVEKQTMELEIKKIHEELKKIQLQKK